MTYVPPTLGPMPPMYLTTYSAESTGRVWHATAPASAAWSAANRIQYFPFSLSRGMTAQKMFWLNGSTASTDNLQVGLYNENFTQIVESSSTTSSGANVCQYPTFTATYLPPGRYWMALWCSGTTATTFRTANTGAAGMNGYYETNASGLPATATPVATSTTSPLFPVFGISFRSTP